MRPKLKWTLPAGVTISQPRYPVPERLRVAGLMNHVFNGDHALLATLSIARSVRRGTALPLVLDADWLACTNEVCVPERGRITLDLTSGDGTIRAGDRQRFDGWRAKLPRPLGATALYQVDGTAIRIGIPYPAAAPPPPDPWLFVNTTNVISYVAPQVVRRTGDWLVVEAVADRTASAPTALDAVFSFGDRSGLGISAVPGAVPSGGSRIGPVAATDGGLAILLAIGGALLGGLILNVMPCVFPIVSLKALSLARAGGDERGARAEALAYTGGVMLTCLALGGIILGLRAAGTQVGWAFQLQDPRIIVVLLALATAITLNLAGAFELRGYGGGEALAGQGGATGSFWTGVLAAFVATPCTGPFMAAALGAALVLPVAAALGVFAGLGLGLALPFLVIGFVPALRRLLPRPGLWMSWFQRALAVPMALTVVALLWLVYRQLGNVAGDWALVTIAVIGVLAFASRWRARTDRPVVMAVTLGMLLAGGAGAIKVDRIHANARVADAGVPFSVERLSDLRAAGKPVFLYFTADWCLTCKVNEKSAIETDLVREAFQKGGATMMVGDWTTGDPAITRFLYAHGASGVPLYLYYPAGGGEPKQLPQLLAPGLLAALTSP